MGYQVLARKWRPGRFSELVGQEHVVTAIANALENNRLHHAYLFTGTRGVGKTTIARIFSKSLNCEEGQGANPCGKCPTCLEIEQGNYVDLIEIDAASRTKVEDTRELLDNVQYKPTRGRFKVYLIDEVHMLSKHSFNALLKTLEEPPPHVKFLLATTDPQKLPITILSRCLQFNLKAMSREQIVDQLGFVLGEENIHFEPSALALLARAANGSMRDALSLTDQAIAQGDNKVLASVVTDMLGLMDKNQLLKMLNAVSTKSVQAVMDIVDGLAEQAPDYNHVIGELSGLLHQIALTQWVPAACKLETTSAKAIFHLAKKFSAEQVQLMYQICIQGRKDLPFAIDGRSALEMTLMRMVTFAPEPTVEQEDDEISGMPGVQLQGQASEQSPASQANQAPEPASQNATASVSEARVKPQPEAVESAFEQQASNTVQAQAHQAEPENGSSRSQASEPLTTQSEAVSNNSSDENALHSEVDMIEQQAQMYRDNEPALPQQAFNNIPQDVQANDDFPAHNQDIPPAPPEAFFQEGGLHEQEPINTPAMHETADIAETANTHTSQSSGSSLTTTQEMLALRQKFKRSSEEDSANDAKKSEAEKSAAPLAFVRGASQDSESDSANKQASLEKVDSPSTTQDDLAVNNPKARHIENTANDAPPWATEVIPEAIGSSVSDAASEANPNAEYSVEPPLSDTTTKRVVGHAENNEKTNSIEDSSDNGTSNTASESTPIPVVEGNIQPYLENGDKLVHSQQIDDWSNIVEGLPVAGLLKQLALHSAFNKVGNQVSLLLSQGQGHLLNDSTKLQLEDALKHGLGEEITLKIEVGTPSDTPYELQQRIKDMRYQHAKHVVQTDAMFTQLRDGFDASVMEGSIQSR